MEPNACIVYGYIIHDDDIKDEAAFSSYLSKYYYPLGDDVGVFGIFMENIYNRHTILKPFNCDYDGAAFRPVVDAVLRTCPDVVANQHPERHLIIYS